MTNTEFLYILIGLLVFIVLTTMASMHQTNTLGLIILFLLGSYYIWKNLTNPILIKGFIFLVAYIVIIIIASFIASYKSSDSGLKTLIREIDLEKNIVGADTHITKISSDAMGKEPSSDVYTYSFSVYPREFNSLNGSLDPYLFYRNENVSSGKKNIGLKMGNTSDTVNVLSLVCCSGDKEITKELSQKIPIGQWTSIIITVYKEYVDVFINGFKLSDNLKIDRLKTPSSEEPIQFGYMPAYLANFSYASSIVEPKRSVIDYFTKTFEMLSY